MTADDIAAAMLVNYERDTIATEAQRRANGLRATMVDWPEAAGAAGALEQFAAWIRERK
jgi:hypothetical protein